MRFTEAKINHFGRLQGEKITFSPGINAPGARAGFPAGRLCPV